MNYFNFYFTRAWKVEMRMKKKNSKIKMRQELNPKIVNKLIVFTKIFHNSPIKSEDNYAWKFIKYIAVKEMGCRRQLSRTMNECVTRQIVYDPSSPYRATINKPDGDMLLTIWNWRRRSTSWMKIYSFTRFKKRFSFIFFFCYNSSFEARKKNYFKKYAESD